MAGTEKTNQIINQSQKKQVYSIAINIILPWVIYKLLHPYFAADTIPLAITAVIPIIRTIYSWLWERKIDWIGLIGIICFTLAIIVSAITGGSALPLKLVQPILFGLVGLSFIISVLFKRPLLLTIVKVIKKGNQAGKSNVVVNKKFTVMTVLFGTTLLVASCIHIVMALTLPTGTFVMMSNVVSMGVIITLILGAKVLVKRIK